MLMKAESSGMSGGTFGGAFDMDISKKKKYSKSRQQISVA